MVRYWLGKLKESFIAVLPIYLAVTLVYILGKCHVPVLINESGEGIIGDLQFIVFSICSIMVAIGLALFGHGAEHSMNKIGRLVADSVMKKRKMWLIVMMTIILGTAATIAEPDLNVVAGELANVFPGFQFIMLITVGLGVGLFFAIGVLRILFNKSLHFMYIAFYGLVFAIACIIDTDLLPLSFDGGGIPTGAVTVPFVLAFGMGIAASKSGGFKGADSFGLIGLCSIGPIIFMMILMKLCGVDLRSIEYHISSDLSDVGGSFLNGFLSSLRMVGIAIAPISIIFLIYNFTVLKLPTWELMKILVGILYLFIGLVVLFTGVYGGFMPIAYELGMSLGRHDLLWLALILVFFFGSFGVLAEPAVHALCGSVEEVSDGGVKKITVLLVMAVAVGVADVLHVLRSYYQFDIMLIIVPAMIVALAISFLVPNLFTALAFDAAGTSSGPITAAFVLPFCVGFCYCVLEANGQSTNDVYVYGYGLCAMMSAIVPIALEIVGLYAIVKRKIAYKRARERIIEPNDDQIIHLTREAA